MCDGFVWCLCLHHPNWLESLMLLEVTSFFKGSLSPYCRQVKTLLLHIKRNQLRGFEDPARMPSLHLLSKVFQSNPTRYSFCYRPRTPWRDCLSSGLGKEDLDISAYTPVPVTLFSKWIPIDIIAQTVNWQLVLSSKCLTANKIYLQDHHRCLICSMLYWNVASMLAWCTVIYVFSFSKNNKNWRLHMFSHSLPSSTRIEPICLSMHCFLCPPI